MTVASMSLGICNMMLSTATTLCVFFVFLIEVSTLRLNFPSPLVVADGNIQGDKDFHTWDVRVFRQCGREEGGEPSCKWVPGDAASHMSIKHWVIYPVLFVVLMILSSFSFLVTLLNVIWRTRTKLILTCLAHAMNFVGLLLFQFLVLSDTGGTVHFTADAWSLKWTDDFEVPPKLRLGSTFWFVTAAWASECLLVLVAIFVTCTTSDVDETGPNEFPEGCPLIGSAFPVDDVRMAATLEMRAWAAGGHISIGGATTCRTTRSDAGSGSWGTEEAFWARPPGCVPAVPVDSAGELPPVRSGLANCISKAMTNQEVKQALGCDFTPFEAPDNGPPPPTSRGQEAEAWERSFPSARRRSGMPPPPDCGPAYSDSE